MFQPTTNVETVEKRIDVLARALDARLQLKSKIKAHKNEKRMMKMMQDAASQSQREAIIGADYEKSIADLEIMIKQIDARGLDVVEERAALEQIKLEADKKIGTASAKRNVEFLKSRSRARQLALDQMALQRQSQANINPNIPASAGQQYTMTTRSAAPTEHYELDSRGDAVIVNNRGFQQPLVESVDHERERLIREIRAINPSFNPGNSKPVSLQNKLNDLLAAPAPPPAPQSAVTSGLVLRREQRQSGIISKKDQRHLRKQAGPSPFSAPTQTPDMEGRGVSTSRLHRFYRSWK